MKILFDYKIFFQQNYGGPARYFAELFESLNEIENNTFILSPIYINEFLKNSKFKPNIIGRKIYPKKFFGKLYRFYNQKISKFTFQKLNPDILHTTYYDEYLISNQKPIVITVHDLIHEIYYKDFGFDKDFRPKKKIIERADQVICVSNATKQDLLKYYNINEKKISVIYHGKQKTINNKECEFKIIKPYFLYLGSRKRYKNFRILLESFTLEKNIFKDFEIICFGGGKFLKEEKNLFQKLKIREDQIKHYSGNDDVLYYLYKNAVALVYPSHYEGFGMPILEAMNLNCPVISSNTSSMPEVFGDAALSFDPKNKIELLECLKSIAFDDKIKNKIIKNGKIRSELFSWEKCSKETLKVYDKLL